VATRAVSALMKAIAVTGQIAGFTGPGYPSTRVLTSLILTILKGSLQPKLKGANVWPFNAHGKVATGWVYHIIIIVLVAYCKEKIDQTQPQWYLWQFLRGPAGLPVFRLDPNYCKYDLKAASTVTFVKVLECFLTFGAKVIGKFVLEERKFSLWTFRSREQKCSGTKSPDTGDIGTSTRIILGPHIAGVAGVRCLLIINPPLFLHR